jgi:hypothetical protein
LGASPTPASLDELRSATYTAIEGPGKPVMVGGDTLEETPNLRGTR